MAYLTNFSFEFFYAIFTEDASLLLLYHGVKKSKMTKNSNQGGPALIGKAQQTFFMWSSYWVSKVGETGVCMRVRVRVRVHVRVRARACVSSWSIWAAEQMSGCAVGSCVLPGENFFTYWIMYELAVCSDGMTEAQPRSFRQNRPASEYIIWHNAHSPANRCSGCSNTCTWIRKKCRLKTLMQRSQDRFRLLLP